jgi:hypothetical protein
MDAPRLPSLLQVVAEHLTDVDLAGAQAGHPRGRLGTPDHQPLKTRLPPVAGHRLNRW